MDFQDFINKTLGKAIDVDGLYGPQCVDLFNYFNKLYNNGVYINCRPSGYARSLAENKANNGILNYYQETAVNNMIEGTVVVYGNCAAAPSSHVAFFVKDNGNGTFQALQQNSPKPYVTLSNMTYNGIIGAFIPKQLVGSSSSSNNTSSSTGADQILYKGSKVKFDGVFKVDILKSPISCNLFGCCTLTGCSYDDYYNERVKDYHWFPAGPFTEVDRNGNPTKDQIFGGGLSYVKNDNVYTVEDIDIPTNSAKLNIDGRDVWVFSKYLKEISDK